MPFVEYTFDFIAAIYRSCSLSRVIDLKNSLGICTCLLCKELGDGVHVSQRKNPHAESQCKYMCQINEYKKTTEVDMLHDLIQSQNWFF